ncbi:vanadium-dependent haloperoxidase [Ferruginibacter paludis]|uniref:vanadium-dependent haloperoxidase n=1 Tax=Ferruginibacter paludis TaxID=1310417 RepID=UPI0025B5BE1F|nr:vanadium-dependent haloperoxidase [Ferruginibacter paludis]MDN3655561.1 vanadium-dependent haloperoxidase [Ferruginibacter paludis]
MRKLIVIIVLLMPYLSNAQTRAWETDATPLHRAQKALTDVIIHDIFSPPVASRIYAYTNIAAYEVLVKQNKAYRSMYTQLNSFPEIPVCKYKICASLAAVNAFLITGKNLVFSEALLQDSITQILQWYKNKKISRQEYDASVLYGQQVASAVMQWAAKDKYKETRSLRRYNYLKQEGKWMPTPPVYMAAVEPNWNRIRPLVLDSASQFRPELPLPFSKDTNSSFYRQVLEVYDTTRHLSAQHIAIASFWDCNPFAVTTEGHLNFATKKISPGGHWMSIAGVVCRSTNATMMKAAAAYSLTAIALFDGFIICWDEKYRSNIIRPETYINKYMDESWRPLLQTPPFPEYTSGHSVISTAAATVLNHFFGKAIGFDDDTEVEFGLPVKHFNSFSEACNEAAISRLYGGIHYRAAIENGQKQGNNLGEWITGKIKMQ